MVDQWGDGEMPAAQPADFSPPQQYQHQQPEAGDAPSSRKGSQNLSEDWMRHQPSIEESEHSQQHMQPVAGSRKGSHNLSESRHLARINQQSLEESEFSGPVNNKTASSRKSSATVSAVQVGTGTGESPEASQDIASDQKTAVDSQESDKKEDEPEDEKSDAKGLEEIMAEQRKGQGKARWEALGKSLKDKREDLLAIVRQTFTLNFYLFYTATIFQGQTLFYCIL